jgi:hypothetical protein
MHLSEESSLHDVHDASPIMRSFHRSSSTSVENHDSVTTSLDLTQGPTHSATISPRANSDSDPLPTTAVSMATPHPLFAPSSSNPIDPYDDTDLGVVPSFLASVSGDTVPGNTHSSLTSPASQICDATPGLLVPSTSQTAISLTPPQGTLVPQPDSSQNDVTFDTHHNSRVADLSRHPLVTTPSSHDIDRPE